MARFFVVAYLACGGHGRRLQFAPDEARQPSSPMSRLSGFLLASAQSAGFARMLRQAQSAPHRSILKMSHSGNISDTTIPDIVASKFGVALADYWRGSFSTRLSEIVSASVVINTPLWKNKNLVEYEVQLSETRGFFSTLSPPALNLLSQQKLPDGRIKLEWILGVEWPAWWRPRVNILGESVLTIAPDSAKITNIEETWHQSPADVFIKQVLPKIRDIVSFWNSPTAEQVPMRLIQRSDGYDLFRIPPMLTLQAEYIETGSTVFTDQAPLAPPFAYTGKLKRKDWFNCISPNILERTLVSIPSPGGGTRTGQRRRWICPLPTRFGSNISDFPDANVGLKSEASTTDEGDVIDPSVQYIARPSQLLALRRLKGIPSNSNVLSAVSDAVQKVEADGYRVVKNAGNPVVIQVSNDIKNGFDFDKKLAMTVWLSVPDFFKEEYVGVIIDDS